MSTMSTRGLILKVCAPLMLIVSPIQVVTSQVATTASSAIIVEGAALPSGTHVAVLRRSHQSPSMMVLVDSAATPADLLVAVVTVGALRARDGDASILDVETIPRGRLIKTPELDRRLVEMDGYLRRLRRAPLANVSGIGTVRSVALNLGMRPKFGP